MRAVTRVLCVTLTLVIVTAAAATATDAAKFQSKLGHTPLALFAAGDQMDTDKLIAMMEDAASKANSADDLAAQAENVTRQAADPSTDLPSSIALAKKAAALADSTAALAAAVVQEATQSLQFLGSANSFDFVMVKGQVSAFAQQAKQAVDKAASSARAAADAANSKLQATPGHAGQRVAGLASHPPVGVDLDKVSAMLADAKTKVETAEVLAADAEHLAGQIADPAADLASSIELAKKAVAEADTAVGLGPSAVQDALKALQLLGSWLCPERVVIEAMVSSYKARAKPACDTAARAASAAVEAAQQRALTQLGHPLLNAEYQRMYQTVSITRPALFAPAVAQIQANRARYETVAAATHVPWEVVGVMHSLQSGNDFRTPLRAVNDSGAFTVDLLPPSMMAALTWEEAAVNAIQLIRLVDSWLSYPSWEASFTLYKLQVFDSAHYTPSSSFLFAGTSYDPLRGAPLTKTTPGVAGLLYLLAYPTTAA